MNPISEDELDKLSVADLALRMDQFIQESFAERNIHLPPGFPQTINLVSQLMATKTISEKTDQEQRKIAYKTFSFLIQLDMGSISIGMQNATLYGPQFSDEKWQSPVFRLKHAVLTQYKVISSRMSFEVFMELLHLIRTGNKIRDGKSKINAFRKWLCAVDNPFHYFAHVLLLAYQFDREQRSPEIHGTSKFPRKLLTLANPSSDDLNEPLQLTNALLNSWNPLIEILNGNRPSSMNIDKEHHGWFKAYMSQDTKLIEQQLEVIFSGIN